MDFVSFNVCGIPPEFVVSGIRVKTNRRQMENVTQKTSNETKDIRPPIRMIKNKEIIKSLSLLRRDIKSKIYLARQKILESKGKALSKLGGLIKDPATRASDITLRLLMEYYPALASKAELQESDWGTKRLLYKSVVALPQRRDIKAAQVWEEISIEAKRISDTRGVDNKIVIKHPESGVEIRTPWYYIPNIVDF